MLERKRIHIIPQWHSLFTFQKRPTSSEKRKPPHIPAGMCNRKTTEYLVFYFGIHPGAQQQVRVACNCHGTAPGPVRKHKGVLAISKTWAL